MAERPFEAVLEDEARRLLELLSPDDQALIYSIIQAIETDPYPDGVHKFLLSEAPDLTAFYGHPRWWVLYRFAEPGHIAIDALAPPLF